MGAAVMAVLFCYAKIGAISHGQICTPQGITKLAQTHGHCDWLSHVS